MTPEEVLLELAEIDVRLAHAKELDAEAILKETQADVCKKQAIMIRAEGEMKSKKDRRLDKF